MSEFNVSNVSNDTSTLQGRQMCPTILKCVLKYKRNGPDTRQARFMTILSFDLQVCP